MFLLILIIAAVVLGVGLPLLLGRADGWRWGVRRLPPVSTGTSPYRDGVVRGEKPNAAPFLVRAGAGLNILWSLITLLCFAPAGFLLILVTLDQAAIMAPLVVLVSIDGFALGVALIIASIGLLRRRRSGRVRVAALWSVFHHIAVAATMFGIAMLSRSADEELFLFSLVPCSFGVGLAGLLYLGYRKAAELDLEDGAEEARRAIDLARPPLEPADMPELIAAAEALADYLELAPAPADDVESDLREALAQEQYLERVEMGAMTREQARNGILSRLCRLLADLRSDGIQPDLPPHPELDARIEEALFGPVAPSAE